MFIDYQAVLSDAQVITNASADSTYYIDTKAAGDAILPGAFVEFLVDTAFTTSDAGTLNLKLQTATSSDLSTGLVTLYQTGAIAAATLTAGKVYRAIIPEGCLRYLFATYTLANNMTAGKIDARIVLEGDKTLDKLL
jgi:hypothetical protein